MRAEINTGMKQEPKGLHEPSVGRHVWQACVAGMPGKKKKKIKKNKKKVQEFLSKTKYLIQKCNRSMHKAVDINDEAIDSICEMQ